MSNLKPRKRRSSVYAQGQHDLICRALDISPDPKAPGITAYEGVCVLMLKLEHVQAALQGKAKFKGLLQFINTSHDNDEVFFSIPLYGTETKKEKS